MAKRVVELGHPVLVIELCADRQLATEQLEARTQGKLVCRSRRPDEDRGIGERHLRGDDDAVVVRVVEGVSLAPEPEQRIPRRVVLRAAVAGEDWRDALAER